MRKFTLGILVLLACANVKAQALPSFEFTVVPTFESPTKLTVVTVGESVWIRTQVWSGLGGYDWGDLRADSERRLREHEIAVLQSQIESLPLQQLSLRENSLCLDSTVWKLTISNNIKVSKCGVSSSEKERGLASYYEFGSLVLGMADIGEYSD